MPARYGTQRPSRPAWLHDSQISSQRLLQQKPSTQLPFAHWLAAVQAVPRLFQHVVIFKGRVRAGAESLYGLWLAILNLKEGRLLRARAVVSYNPAVYASELDIHWFDFEARLYACRLWAGTALIVAGGLLLMRR